MTIRVFFWVGICPGRPRYSILWIDPSTGGSRPNFYPTDIPSNHPQAPVTTRIRTTGYYQFLAYKYDKYDRPRAQSCIAGARGTPKVKLPRVD